MRAAVFAAGLGMALAMGPREIRGSDYYHIENLGTVIGATNSYAHGINSAGNVVGYFKGTNGVYRAFLLKPSELTLLGGEGTNTFSLHLNDADQVVGYGTTTNGTTAFHAYAGTFTDLGVLGGTSSYAHGINSATNIVGYIGTTNGAVAFRYQNGTATLLGNLGGTNTFAFAINDSGLIVGTALTASNVVLNAFVAGSSGMTNLNDVIGGGAGWELLDARGINAGGDIVGWGVTNGVEHAYFLESGTVHDIAPFAGGTNSYALGVNDSNVVVGASTLSAGRMHAFAWKGGAIVDLNDYIPSGSGWELVEARGVNNAGQIVGWGKVGGQEQAFLLSPNILPTVNLTAPTNNTISEAPVALTLKALASDSDGTVVAVKFYQGTNLIGIDTTSPYSIMWSNVPPGTYTITAQAVDDLGESSDSSATNVMVLLPLTNRIKLWLNAGSITNLTNGAAVATWSDKSSLGNNATQSSSGNRPTWVSSGVNGLPVVRFDGVNDYFSLPNLMNGATQAEVFVVLKAQTEIPGVNKTLWRFGSYSSPGDLRYPSIAGRIVDEFGSSSSFDLGDPAQPLSGFHLYNASSKTNEWVARINGVKQYEAISNTVGFNSAPTLGGSVSYFDGDIAEMIIYDCVLTAAERTSVAAYLSTRYALASTLPEAPTNLVATALSPTQASLQWGGKVEQGITRTSIERKEGTGGTYAVVGEVQGASSYLDGALSAATTYYYRVRAANGADWSEYSNEASATTSSTGTNLPLADLRLWLKADAGLAQIGTNSAISYWEDQSGRKKHAAQGTTALRPQWRPNQVNGRPAVHFDGTSSYFSLPNLMNGATQAEVFVVLKAQNDTPGSNKALWRFGSNGAGNLRYPAIDSTIVEEFGSSSSYNIGDPAQALNSFHLYNVSSKTNEWIARINGVLQYRTTNNTVGFVTTPSLGYSGSYYFDGDVSELLVYDRVLTGPERTAVAGYLARRYGLAPSVPERSTNLLAGAISPTQIALQWEGRLDQGLTRISIERKTGAGGSYSVLAETQYSRSYLDTTASADTEYYYRIRGSNAAEWSAYSNEAGAMTPATGTNMPLADLRLWLKADAGLAQIGTNASLNAWEDQSGRGKHAAQSVSVKRPQWRPGQINGRPVIHFDGANHHFGFGDLMNGATQAEAFVVLKAQNDMPGSTKALWRFGSNPGTGNLQYPSTVGAITDEFGSYSNAYTIGDPAQPLNGFHLYNVSTRTNDWTARINGLVQYNSPVNTVGFASAPVLGFSGSYYFDGDIAEVLIYDRVLSVGERNAVSAYLNRRFSLAAAIPATPSNLVAGALSPSQISLQWNGAVDQGLTRISIERRSGAGGTFSTVAGVQGTQSYIDTGLTPGTTYYYRVRAANTTDWTPYSNEAGAVTAGTGTNLPLSDLRLWLKADAGIAQIGTNSAISLWEDQSGKAKHGFQSTSTYRPEWRSAQLNGRPAVHFDGANDSLNFSSVFAGATEGEAFIVVKAQSDVPAASKALWRFGNNNGSGNLRYPSFVGTITDEFGSNSNTYDLGDPAQTLGSFHVFNVSSKTNEWIARLNSVIQYNTTNNTVGFATAPILGYSGWNYFEGDVAEVLMFERVLTVAERTSVAGYLSRRYGIAAAAADGPTNLVAGAISATQVNVQWDGRLDQGATRVSIERRTGMAGMFAVVGEVQNARSYLDGGLTAGTTYYYRVRAANTTDWSAYSGEAPATTAVAGTDMPLTDLRLWLKADAGVPQIGTNAALNSWEDQSGRGKHAFQSASANRPQWNAAQIGGRPAVRFDGVNDSFSFANTLGGATQAEAFVVLKTQSETPGSGKALWRMGSVNTGGNVRYPGVDGGVIDEFGSASAYFNLGDPAQLTASYHLYNPSSKSNEWTARINGVIQYVSSANTVGFHSTPLLGWSGYNYFEGDIAEVLMYDRVLSSAERNTVNIYLNRRYGLAGTLPDTPTNLVAGAVSSSQISLQWGGRMEQGLTRVSIERKPRFGGEYEAIGEVRNARSFLDSGLAAGSTYYYRVRAANFTDWSEYSTEAAASTLASGTNMPLSGLRLWLKADAGLAQTGTNSFLNSWEDQSGSSAHAWQNTAANKAQWIMQTNGRPTVRFDGANDSFSLPNFMSSATQAEAFVVLKATADPATTTRALWRVGSYGSLADLRYPSTSGNIVDSFGSASVFTTGDPAPSLAGYHLYNVSSLSTQWLARISALGQGTNGTNFHVYANTNNTVGFTSTPLLGSSSWYYFAGDIAEVLVYDRVLEALERSSVTNYLTRRYFTFDADADGLPDDWELRYRGSLTDLGAGDYDADGVGDRDELVLGTDPTQTDTDGDGALDNEDLYPLDPTRAMTVTGLLVPVGLQVFTPLN